MRYVTQSIIKLGIIFFIYGYAVLLQAADFNQFKLDLMLAQRGDPGAQFYVANAYEEGRGVTKNLQKAFEWYSKAAANNHNGAQFKLGEYYNNGWAVTKDPTKASQWFEKAAKNGSSLAKKRLADIKAGKLAALNKQKALRAEQIKTEERKRLKAERAERARQEKLKQQKLAAERKKRLREERLAKLKHKKIEKAAPASTEPVKKTVSRKNIPVKQLVSQVLDAKWRSANTAAANLPSTVNNCLKSSDSEIICFSTEQQRIVGNSNVMFTTKSTLTNFQANGQFDIKYYYNVLDISSSEAKGPATDPAGLRLAKGWQEPQLLMKCQVIDNKRLSCVQGKYKFNFSS